MYTGAEWNVLMQPITKDNIETINVLKLFNSMCLWFPNKNNKETFLYYAAHFHYVPKRRLLIYIPTILTPH